VEVQEGDEGDPILSSRMVASLCESGSMRSSLDTGTNRERYWNPKLAPWTKFKIGTNLGALKKAGVPK